MGIKFITELKEYRQQRMDAIQGKKDLLERLQLRLSTQIRTIKSFRR